MPGDASDRNWFDAGGEQYSRFRPTYPPELAERLAAAAPARRLAVDVGCGNGQLTRLLAGQFEQVVGIDASADQIAHADPHERVVYRRAAAESLPFDDGTVDCVTAAQAAHWFDLPAFYAEVARIAAPGAVVALVSYGIATIDDERVDARFRALHRDQLGHFWPPERQHVDEGYRSFDFPFMEWEPEPLAIERALDAQALLGYVSTWSAVRAARDAGAGALLIAFAADLAELWPPQRATLRITWPVTMRIGQVAGGPTRA